MAFSVESSTEALTLGDDEVQVWRANLDIAGSRLQRLRQSLSGAELAKAGRFRAQIHRDRFVAARGTLRAILGRYLGVESGRLRFSYNTRGKPSLDREFGGDELQFNLSHSEGLALYAVTYRRAIGVDLERIRPTLGEDKIAERFFSPTEVEALLTLPADLRKMAFFTCWTRKEAYIKATGQGLTLPLDQFDVSLCPGEPAALLSTKWDPDEARRWSLRELSPGSGFVGAIAVNGHGWRLACRQWPE